MKYVLIILFSLLIVGCGDKDMRDTFGESEHIFVHVETGEKYFIQHHIGDTYSVKPVPENILKYFNGVSCSQNE